MAITIGRSFYEGWSGENLSSPGQGRQVDDRPETRQLLNVVLDYLNSEENSNKRLLGRERVTRLKGDFDRQSDLLRLQDTLLKVEGKVNSDRLRSLTDLTTKLQDSWLKYYTSTSRVYPKVEGIFRNEIGKKGITAAWGTVFGSIDQDPGVVIDRDSPKFLATFREMNRRNPAVQFDDKGNVVMNAKGEPVLVQGGFDGASERAIRQAATDYQRTKNKADQALAMFESVNDIVADATAQLGAGNTDGAQSEFDKAKIRLERAHAESESALGQLDVEALAQEIARLEEKDEVHQAVRELVPSLLERVSGTTGMGNWQPFVDDEQFKAWAADRGIRVGTYENGKYRAGPNDEFNVAKFITEQERRPGDYGFLLNKFTDEIVQVTDKQGNIIARGFRQPVHAADGEGDVRVMVEGGQSLVFSPGEVGVVDVVQTYPGGRRIFGSEKRRRNMADAFAYLNAYADLGATKPSEEVVAGKFATRDSIDGEEYMTKSEYERAVQQADVEVGRFAIDRENKKAYVRFGTEVFNYDPETFELSKVVDPVVTDNILSLPSAVALRDDDTPILYSDVVTGRGEDAEAQNNLGQLKFSDPGDATKQSEELGRTRFLESQGVKLTDKPRQLIKGKTRTVMGVTFRDSEIPLRPEARDDEPARPGDDPFRTTPKETGALPIAAIRTQEERKKSIPEGGPLIPEKISRAFVGDRSDEFRAQPGDAELMRQMLRQDAADAGEPQPPRQAKKAASFIRPELAKFKRDPAAALDDEAFGEPAGESSSEPESPTPDNSLGKTDLVTQGEVKSSSNPDPEKKKKEKTKEATESPAVDRGGD